MRATAACPIRMQLFVAYALAASNCDFGRLSRPCKSVASFVLSATNPLSRNSTRI